jgi:hypothetical protein
MGKKDNCCVDPDDSRVIAFEGPWPSAQMPMYTVPAGKLFVLTAWTVYAWSVGDISLYRNGSLVAFMRTVGGGSGHQVYPDGIVFTAGQTIDGNMVNGGMHLFYGREIDA